MLEVYEMSPPDVGFIGYEPGLNGYKFGRKNVRKLVHSSFSSKQYK